MRTGTMATVGALAALGLSVAAAPRADAGYIATIQQVGANVVETGSGSLNTTDLGSPLSDAVINSIQGGLGFTRLNNGTSAAPVSVYLGISGPSLFGGGGAVNGSSATNGQDVGVEGAVSALFVPVGYVSGTSLGISTVTFDGTTLAALGLTLGTYTWTWGTAGNADSFTLNIGVPEPGSLVLLGSGLLALGLVGFASRRRPAGRGEAP